MATGDGRGEKSGAASSGRAVACALAIAALSGAAAAAAENIGGKPDPAYLTAVRGLRIQSEIVYMPPTAPLDVQSRPSEPAATPERPPEGDSVHDVLVLRWLLIGIAGAVLAFLAVFVVRNSAGGRALFAKPLAGEGRPRSSSAPALAEAPLPPGLRLLAELAGLPDRREALRRLTEHALDRATRQNGIRLGRSQTARDVLRFLPAGWRHRAALGLVIRTEEVVRFGGEPLAESTFAECLAAMRPLFADHAAA
jgi:hypothetical protein